MAYRQYFGVGRDIKVRPDCFSGLADDPGISHDERTDRRISGFPRQFSQFDTAPHETRV